LHLNGIKFDFSSKMIRLKVNDPELISAGGRYVEMGAGHGYQIGLPAPFFAAATAD
jgi:hypothetical protein